jgi:tetratricopeptide (TPR) repeat protein
MFFKNIKFILILLLFYQNPSYSKSRSSENFDAKNLSNYFSGIIALENKNNSYALSFFDSSKSLINKHDPFIEKYITSLVLENKVSRAVNIIKGNIEKDNSKYFDAYLILILESIKNKNFELADKYLDEAFDVSEQRGLEIAILESFKDYVYVFRNKTIKQDNRNFGNLSLINQMFQRCYLDDPRTDNFFFNVINNNEADYSRYNFFYMSYLIENNRIEDLNKLVNEIGYINASLLLSQAKSWIENKNQKKINQVFSCKNHNHIIGEFLFLISSLYSSQDNFEKSNFFINLSLYLNPKFIYNFSLISENYYSIKDYKKTKKILRNFKKDDEFYYWYRIKKEAQIISKEKNVDESVKFIEAKFYHLDKSNVKFLYDLANYYRSSKRYKEAIPVYTKILDEFDNNDEMKSDLLYRRGSSYERIKNFDNADDDLLNSLKIYPDDAYVLNYLAYSWLEREYKINEAIKMLEIAYEAESDDPYIIDSIGWAYYLINDFSKAEEFLIRAVELMPDDPIVNDHYGDVLWKLDRKIQARYFWSNVLLMNDVEDEIINKINSKLIQGL